MSITPFIFLVIYLIGVGLFVLLSLLNIYHILRFGFLKTGSILVTFVYLCLALGIVYLTLQSLGHVAWREPMEINTPFLNTNGQGS